MKWKIRRKNGGRVLVLGLCICLGVSLNGCGRKKVEVEEDNKLVIYGLEKESVMINAAIEKFSLLHPEVSVEYQIGSENVSGAAARGDNIRLLNTELLNGKGPDVLMLEGLPIQSYMEKGVLADLSDVLEPYFSDGTLLQSFTKDYTMDGEIYGLTLRYWVPVVVGTTETIEIIKDVGKLGNWLEEHPGEAWTDSWTTFEEMFSALLHINYKKLVRADGSFEPEVLSQCLTVAKEMEDRLDPEEVEERRKVIQEMQNSSHCFEIGNIQNSLENEKAMAADFRCLENMESVWRVVRENNLAYDTLEGLYIPNRIAGINSHTRHPKQAEEFIELLLSESVQRSQGLDGYYEGLPCSQKVIEKLISESPETLEESIARISHGDSERFYEKGYEYLGCELLRREARELFDMSLQIDTPAEIDWEVMQMVMEEAKLYQDGSETAEEAAKKMEEKTKVYMQE